MSLGLAGVLLFFGGLAGFGTRLFVGAVSTPWIPMGVLTAGAALLLASLARRRTRRRIVGAASATVVTALLWVGVTVVFAFPGYDGPATRGRPAPEFRTTTAEGRTLDQDALRGRRTLIVFYRGRW